MRFGACLSVVAFAVTLRLTYAKVKCVSAEGMIICPKDPDKVADVEVYLMDADGFLNSDDTMGWTISNENGDFRVDGCGDDFWSVPDPYLKIKPSRGSKEQVITTPVKYVFSPNISDFGLIDISGDQGP